MNKTSVPSPGGRSSVAVFQANPERHGCRQANATAVNFTEKLILIAGSAYTGEIKKGMFSVMNLCCRPNTVCFPALFLQRQ